MAVSLACKRNDYNGMHGAHVGLVTRYLSAEPADQPVEGPRDPRYHGLPRRVLT